MKHYVLKNIGNQITLDPFHFRCFDIIQKCLEFCRSKNDRMMIFGPCQFMFGSDCVCRLSPSLLTVSRRRRWSARAPLIRAVEEQHTRHVTCVRGLGSSVFVTESIIKLRV